MERRSCDNVIHIHSTAKFSVRRQNRSKAGGGGRAAGTQRLGDGRQSAAPTRSSTYGYGQAYGVRFACERQPSTRNCPYIGWCHNRPGPQCGLQPKPSQPRNAHGRLPQPRTALPPQIRPAQAYVAYADAPDSGSPPVAALEAFSAFLMALPFAMRLLSICAAQTQRVSRPAQTRFEVESVGGSSQCRSRPARGQRP